MTSVPRVPTPYWTPDMIVSVDAENWYSSTYSSDYDTNWCRTAYSGTCMYGMFLVQLDIRLLGNHVSI